MKVLLVNGSPHKEGCTYTALCEVSRLLNEHGIDTDIFWIGTKALTGCIACRKCIDSNRCVFNDTVNEFLDIAGDYDGFVFGSPVHWGGASGAMGGINKAGTFGAGVAGGFAGNTLGRVSHTSGHGAKAATQGRNMAVRNDN